MIPNTRRQSIDPRPAVLVIGAGGGIGRAVIAALAGRNFRVFGTFREPSEQRDLVDPLDFADSADTDMLAPGATPVRMDLTDAQSIRTGLEVVSAELDGAPLAGLVNAAGVSGLCPLAQLPLAEMRHVLEVNLVGPIAVCQASLPLLKASRGRIVNISSVSARAALPYLGAYGASKAALEAASDSLRQELRPFGVDVIVVRPGAVRTGMAARLPPEPPPGADAHDAATARAVANVRRALLAGAAHGVAPEAVAEAVLRALTDPRPPACITVAAHSWRIRLMSLLPARRREARAARWIWR